MPHAEAQGARIYYEETGPEMGPETRPETRPETSQATPILFIHEFAGDYRSWHGQMRHFGRGWRCITWSARGYPLSDCPEDEQLYGQDFFTADAVAVLDAAGVDKAHVVGLSMGGYTALSLAIAHPGRLISCVAAGAGSGGLHAHRQRFIAESLARADAFERAGRIDAEAYCLGPTRVQLQRKHPMAWRAFVEHLGEHQAHAAAKTLRRVQAGRAALEDMEARLSGIELPVLLLVGDEDEPCLDVNLWMKRRMPSARLAVLPGSGHVLNIEEPALFNGLVEQFITDVERGSWHPRDARAR
jgi:pimeloyl-ACP methyl ester carboxylesterase